jgi:ABC-type glycerol-3-phosphate transport system substrate-binding protein
MRRGLLVSLSFLALAGCATGPSLSTRMAAYIGADMQTLVQQLGVPNKQITVNGIQYVAYDEQRQVVVAGGYMGGWYGPNWFYGGGYYPYSPSVVTYGCETTFMLKNGKVVNFTLRGNDCN